MNIYFNDCSISIGKTTILSSVNFTLKKNQCLYIKGTNGSGKTIFMESILGLHPKIIGSYNVSIKDVCYIPDLSFFSDDELIKDVLWAYRVFYKQSSESLTAALTTLSLSLNPKAKIATLSLGTKKKLELLPLFFNSYSIYILDEIFQSLDSDTVLLIGKVLQEHHKMGATIIFTEHNQYIVDYIQYLIPTLEVYICENQKLFKLSS